ncbi:glycosyltransferase family 2 protein [Algoriphagus chordae]|nr:glycosyltransferase family A protein [Algoriphagus chordae]
MIPAYNCSNYLIETIKSVLQQDMGEELMQIEVVDDCSTDADIAALVLELGKGRVKYYRQQANVGSLRNFETCINRALGQYIHLLHGDDRVKNGYYSSITKAFKDFPEVGAAFSPWDHIKATGELSHKSRLESEVSCVLDNWLEKLAEYPRLQYVAISVKREVYEKLGSFCLVTYGEDWEMWARIAKEYSFAYVPEYLAEYREHTNSITWQSYQTGQNVKDIVRVIDKINTYLPKEKQRRMSRIAKRNYSYWVLNETFTNWFTNKNNTIAYSQIKTVLSIHIDRYVTLRTSQLLFYIWSEPYRKLVRSYFPKSH